MHPKGWHSLWINFNTRRDNIIFSADWQLIDGEMWLGRFFKAKKYAFSPPASFAQANMEMFEKMLENILNFIPPQADLLEYYAGVGAIGLALAERCRRVRCVEIVRLAKQCFDMSYSLLEADLQKRLSYICGPAGAYTALLQDGADVVVVDPPRKGLEAALLKALCVKNEIKRIIYISCGWESFQRGLQSLVRAWLEAGPC